MVESEHIHEVGDGRPPRRVFVDGVEIERGFYADTLRGFVRYHYEPIRINRRHTSARWAKKRGKVEVVEIPGAVYTNIHICDSCGAPMLEYRPDTFSCSAECYDTAKAA